MDDVTSATPASTAPSKPSRGDLLEVSIEKVVFGGDGLARLSHGFVVFVPFTAEGDHLRVRIIDCKKNHARGEIVEILHASTTREVPLCPYYQRCGGCQYQHLSYAEECRLKEKQVYEALVRVGKIPEPHVLPIIPSPANYGYRNRITVHAEAGKIGFRSVNGRDLIDILACAISRPQVNGELARLRSRHPSDGHHSLRESTVPPSGFFQSNHGLREALRDLVAEALPAQAAILLEGYCGGGFFTERVAARFQHVVAVDNDPRTLLDAQRLGLNNVEWREADAAEVLPGEIHAHAGLNLAVLLDPPREGLSARLTDALCLDPVPRLVYVSCDPATLARDARVLSTRYELISVQPIDGFPRTAQIECISSWRSFTANSGAPK